MGRMPGGSGGDASVTESGPVFTVFFSDVVGSTELYHRRGNVLARASIAVHDDLARKAVATYGGRVVKTLGDGAMAVFDSPRAALAAAAALQDAVAAARRADPGFTLEVRIGLNAGEVLLESDGDVHGAAVAVAARVAAHAGPGQVLASEMVARLAGRVPGVELTELGAVALKGVGHPVSIRDVRWEPSAFELTGSVRSTPTALAPDARSTQGRRPEFLGRTSELADFGQWLAEAANGDGRLVLLAGEPGIGKTRLAEAVAEQASVHGMAVAWGRCAEDEGAPPLWPWRQISDALGMAAGDLVDAGEAPVEQRFLAFERFVERLREAARNQPAVLLFDDLHWADHASLLLLRHALRVLPVPRILMIGSYRSTEPGGLGSVLADLERSAGFERLDLSGLGEDDVRRHLEATSGRAVSDVVARQVSDATAGNPFFVGEIGRAHRSGSWSERIPASVRDVTRQRLSRLSSGCAGLLRAAAVIGRDFPTPLLALVAGVDVDAVLGGLDEGARAGLIEPGRTEGEHRFSHALIRDAIEHDIGSGDRVTLHVEAARGIEALYAGRHEPHLPELARHWAVAAPAGHGGVAAYWAERAANAAVAGLAYEEAVRLFGLALDVGGPTLGPVDRARLHLALARAHVLAGELDASVDASFAAAALGRETARPDLIAQAALVMEGVGRPDLSARVHELCVEALEHLDGPGGEQDDHDALRARLLAQLSHLSLYLGQHDRVDELSAEAVARARGLSDDTVLVAALRARQEARSGPEGRDERVELAELMLAAGQRLRSPSVVMWGHLWRQDIMLEDGRLAAAAADLDRLAEVINEVGGPLPRWHLARCRTIIRQAQGELADAHASGFEAYQILSAVDPLHADRTYFGVLAAIGRHARLLDDQLTRLVDPGHEAFRFRLLSGLAAVALFDHGRIDEARAIFLRLDAPSVWALPPFIRIMTLAANLMAAIRLDQHEEVDALHRLLSPYRGRYAVSGAGPIAFLGPVELYLGAAARSLGRYDEAVADLERAVERARTSGAVGFAVEATCELADALLQRSGSGDHARARAALERAGSDAATLGFDLLADRARELLAVAGDAATT